MPRQPLAELPLSAYIVVDDHSLDSLPGALGKPGLPLSSILSPPKRRILAEEGFAVPLKSPAKRLFFTSAPSEEPRPSSLMDQLSAATSDAPSGWGAASTTAASHSSSSSSRSSSSSGTPASPLRPSKLSITTSSAPSTPPVTRSRTRSLAPSPEITDSPMDMEPDSRGLSVPPTRPGSLKRLRSEGSSGGTSPVKSPTPKRRIVARETSPSLLVTPVTDEEDEPEDKENVPPPRKKRGAFKAPLPVVRSPRDPCATPRAGLRGSSPAHPLTPRALRARKALLEAEVDMPDSEPGMF